jgi:4-amino-4-deoxy-L-arabinose transferase-like glycosyltransferase
MTLIRLTGIAKSKWANLCLFLLSIILCSLSWLVIKPAFVFDPGLHFDQRISIDYIEALNGLTTGQHMKTFYEPPLFPVTLAIIYKVSHAFGGHDRLLLALYALVSTALSTVVLFQVAKLIWGPLSAFIVACLWASYPPAIMSASYLGSETLFILCLFLSVYCLFRLIQKPRPLREYAVFGLCLGLTMMARAVAVGLLFFFLLLLWYGTRRKTAFRRYIQQVAVIFVVMFIVILPWELVAYAQLNQVILLSNADASSLVEGATYAYDMTYHCPVDIPADVYAFQKDIYDQKFKSTGQIVSYVANQLAVRPQTVVLHYFIKALNSWYRTQSCQYDNLLLVVQIPYLLLFIVATVPAMRRKGNPPRATLLAWATVGYFWVTTIIVFSILRYMVPTIGLLFLITPAIADLWQNHASQKETAESG